MERTIPVLAGAVSTVIFACSTLPMLVKAARTKDLSSYSLGNILLSNLGNVVHSIYVFHLPAGPIWALHTFYLVSTALMLVWYLRYTESPILRRRLGLGRSPDATGSIGRLASWPEPPGLITLGGDVEARGEVSHEEKVELLARAAARLFPIQWPEPFGLVMTEAMACGTPVIAWRNGEEPRPSTTAGRPRHHGRYLDAASSTTVSHMVVARTTIMAIRM